MGDPTQIPFPLSSWPGEYPGEGKGRLVNAFAEGPNEAAITRCVPGFRAFATTTGTGPRGMLDVKGTLYAAFANQLWVVTSGGGSALVPTALSGTLPVSMAHNNKSPTPDIAVVTELGPFLVTPSTVTAWPDADLPTTVNSVAQLSGYFLWTQANGNIWASDLNSTAVNALSFSAAQAKPDGLIRVVASGGYAFFFGDASYEVWADAGASPFPLARADVIPVGLAGFSAIAGFESGWDLTLIFVAADGTVRRINGFQPEVVSIPPVERAIQSVTDKSTLVASVYTFAGHAVWSLSSPTWTWEYNASTGRWHERESFGQTNWRGRFSQKFAGKWLLCDTASGKLHEVTEAAQQEDGSPLVFKPESAPVRAFPSGFRIPPAYFDMSVGLGSPVGTEEETNPEVGVRWSKDGGATWSSAALRRALGQEGNYNRQIRINQMGLTAQHGVRFRLECSAPVHRVLRGGVLKRN